MKKNVMMRLACFLLVAVLISTSAISGTYAKYVTKGTAADDARVAKWGVKIEPTSEMFSNSYKDTKTDYTPSEAGDAITVQSYTPDDKVIAPGTEGALASFKITGTPEVDTEVTYTPSLYLTGWNVDGAEYCPIVFTVGTETFKIGDTGIDTVAQLIEKVQAAIVAKTAKYHTNQDLSVVNDDLYVAWEWPFETGADATEKAANNIKDTALGNAAADGNAAKIALSVTITISQVD